AMNHEAAGAGRDHVKVDLRRKARGLVEHHVAVARKAACIEGAIGQLRPDDEVVEAVAVDVASRGYRIAGLIVGILAVDDKAAGPGGHIHQIDRHVFRSLKRLVTGHCHRSFEYKWMDQHPARRWEYRSTWPAA